MALYVNGKKVAGIGLPGKSAYQYAVDGGYTGTEEEFQEVLANAGGKPMVHGVTLLASAWSGNAQTITVPGVLADETKQLISSKCLSFLRHMQALFPALLVAPFL